VWTTRRLSRFSAPTPNQQKTAKDYDGQSDDYYGENQFCRHVVPFIHQIYPYIIRHTSDWKDFTGKSFCVGFSLGENAHAPERPSMQWSSSNFSNRLAGRQARTKVIKLQTLK
jgi:hypothetical protein